MLAFCFLPHMVHEHRRATCPAMCVCDNQRINVDKASFRAADVLGAGTKTILGQSCSDTSIFSVLIYVAITGNIDWPPKDIQKCFFLTGIWDWPWIWFSLSAERDIRYKLTPGSKSNFCGDMCGEISIILWQAALQPEGVLIRMNGNSIISTKGNPDHTWMENFDACKYVSIHGHTPRYVHLFSC